MNGYGYKRCLCRNDQCNGLGVARFRPPVGMHGGWLDRKDLILLVDDLNSNLIGLYGP